MEPLTMHDLTAAYVLDALDPKEAREYEEHLATCERCREELAQLGGAASALAFAVESPAPPEELRSRILARARAERPNVVPFRRRRSWTAPLAAAAALAACAAVVLGIWAASLANEQDPLEKVLSKPGARLVSMGDAGGVAVAPDGSAVLALALPRAPAGKTYEAWVIRGSKPTPAGLFPGHAGTSIVRIRPAVGRGTVVAVTLERAGGVPQPTQKPLAQSGEVA